MRELKQYTMILALGLCVGGCNGVRNWADDASGDESAPVVFPDLSQLPTPPVPPPNAEARSVTLQRLEAVRTENQQAGESLDSQIEDNFEFPSASGNPVAP